MSANTMVNAQNDNGKAPARLPEDLRPVHNFLTGAHAVGLDAEQCGNPDRKWRCAARDAACVPSCTTEEVAATMKVAITKAGVPVVLCPNHAVALHKEGGVDTRMSLDAYVKNIAWHLRDQERQVEKIWRSRQEVQGLLDLF